MPGETDVIQPSPLVTEVIRDGLNAKNNQILPSFVYEGIGKDGEPDGKYHIDCMKYSDVLKERFRIYNFINTLYIYNKEQGTYKTHINHIETDIRDTCKKYNICDRLSTTEREIITHLKSMGCVDSYPFIGTYGTIHVRNGSLNLDNGEIIPTSPEMLYDYRIETEYKKFNETTELDKFLEIYGTREPIDVLAKCIWQRGYHDTLKELTVFFGPRDSGKTTLSELIQSTLDGDMHKRINVNRSLLHELLQRFGYSGLEGKLLNYGDDLPDMFIKNSGRVNTLVGSVVQHVEKKCIDGYDTIITAYYLFSANNLPPLDDDDNVIWGKIHLVEFKKVITGPRVPRETLFTTIIKEQLLYRAIEKVMKWTKTPYVNTQTADYVRSKWHESSTDVEDFLQNATNFEPGASSTLEKIKSHYDEWCKHNRKERHVKYLIKKVQPFIRRQNTGNVYCLQLKNFKPADNHMKL